MEYIKRRLSMNSDPEKDKTDKPTSSKLMESLSTRRATLWSDFTSKIKSDRPSSESSDVESESTTKSVNNSKSFIESIKAKLQRVKLYENGDAGSEGGSIKLRGSEPECASLIDTAANQTEGGSDIDGGAVSDIATCGESEAEQPSVAITVNGESDTTTSASIRRRRLSKRQDSLTAEEVYLDTVAAQVRSGLVQPDSETALVSPSKAVQEFVFAEDKTTKRAQAKKKSDNSLKVSNGNLINFDSIQNLSEAASTRAETVVHHEDDEMFNYESSGEESSEPVYTEFASRKSNSLDSINSLESAYEDEESKQSKEYADKFVDLIFSDIAPTPGEKTKLARFVLDGNFRFNFARAISEKRANRKEVGEHTFYQLVQYFALILFECSESDDYSPAVILMNMCFTFYYEASRAGKVEKNFLSTYLKSQPIWQSMRYWNAAFYESVQKERMRKPLTTNKDNADEESQDRQFQENIIFGQLGTFLYNMRAFGLNMEWCLEFLRKQSTIGNLSEEHIQMLRESVESVKTE